MDFSFCPFVNGHYCCDVTKKAGVGATLDVEVLCDIDDLNTLLHDAILPFTFLGMPSIALR